jgi:tripeptidyl-peptidase I
LGSDPFHERYGQHLSKEEVDNLITPHPDSVNLVEEWLVSHGLSRSELSRTASGDWIKVKIPVSLAEKMLDTVSIRSYEGGMY